MRSSSRGSTTVVYFNTSLSYSINDRIRLNLVVDNILDTKNPFPTPAAGGTITYFDGIRGRFFRFGAGVMVLKTCERSK
jgi:outer membrane receptor protein involved in Fe transport